MAWHVWMLHTGCLEGVLHQILLSILVGPIEEPEVSGWEVGGQGLEFLTPFQVIQGHWAGTGERNSELEDKSTMTVHWY